MKMSDVRSEQYPLPDIEEHYDAVCQKSLELHAGDNAIDEIIITADGGAIQKPCISSVYRLISGQS